MPRTLWVVRQLRYETGDEMGLKRRTINVLGLLACVGALVGVTADLLSGWSSGPSSMNSAVSLDIESIRAIYIGKPRWTFALGNHLAVFFLPFHMLGFFLVYQAIVPAGRRKAIAFLGGRTLLHCGGNWLSRHFCLHRRYRSVRGCLPVEQDGRLLDYLGLCFGGRLRGVMPLPDRTDPHAKNPLPAVGIIRHTPVLPASWRSRHLAATTRAQRYQYVHCGHRAQPAPVGFLWSHMEALVGSTRAN